jgi:hypothetical protein
MSNKSWLRVAGVIAGVLALVGGLVAYSHTGASNRPNPPSVVWVTRATRETSAMSGVGGALDLDVRLAPSGSPVGVGYCEGSTGSIVVSYYAGDTITLSLEDGVAIAGIHLPATYVPTGLVVEDNVSASWEECRLLHAGLPPKR